MPRDLDLDLLSSRRFDLVVVGGGIYGLICACDAAQRGLSVALVERGDFGSGSSFNHLRTIHGGLRYLQSLDIVRARESVRERRMLARIAPAALRPLPFVLPLTRSLTQGRLAMRAGFLLDRGVAGDRNDGVPQSHVLPPGIVLSADAARARFPALHDRDLAGAAVWHDYVTVEPDRLTLAWATAAMQAGATLANYVEAAAIVSERGQVAGVRARDRQASRAIDIRAAAVVNATGGAIDQLLAPARIATGLPMILAMNLVTRLEAPPHALGGRTRQGRTLFMVPWRGRAVFGTWESAAAVTAGSRPTEADIRAFLAEINEAFPGATVSLTDITRVQSGVVPAVREHGGRYRLAGSELIHDHGSAGVHGLFSIAGTKYTTARAVAERVIDGVVALQDEQRRPCQTSTRPLPIVMREGAGGLRLAAEHECVVTLEDAVMRRTALAALGHPGQEALAEAAAIVGDALGWDADRRAAEIRAVETRYGTSNA